MSREVPAATRHGLQSEWFSSLIFLWLDLHTSGSPRPHPSSYVSRFKMLWDRLVVYGRILVGQSPFSDSASQPGLLGTSGESMSYTAAYRAIPGALVDSRR